MFGFCVFVAHRNVGCGTDAAAQTDLSGRGRERERERGREREGACDTQRERGREIEPPMPHNNVLVGLSSPLCPECTQLARDLGLTPDIVIVCVMELSRSDVFSPKAEVCDT